MKNHRQEQILEILKEKGKVNVHNLSEYFSVTPKTIRRDLEFLEENDVKYDKIPPDPTASILSTN